MSERRSEKNARKRFAWCVVGMCLDGIYKIDRIMNGAKA